MNSPCMNNYETGCNKIKRTWKKLNNCTNWYRHMFIVNEPGHSIKYGVFNIETKEVDSMWAYQSWMKWTRFILKSRIGDSLKLLYSFSDFLLYHEYLSCNNIKDVIKKNMPRRLKILDE